MTLNKRVAAVLDELDAALRGPIGVRRVDSVEEFMATGTYSRYLREPRLTLALHFDIEPKFLVLDPLLGTLGIVELLMPSAGPTEIDTLVRRCIDRATYLRHLLLRDGKRGQRRPLSVELVLLTTDPVGDEEGTLEPIGKALRSVFQDMNSLFHIGVSVLSHRGPGKSFDGQLRRAFPWLLTATRRWLVSSRANPEGAQNKDGRTLRRLKLRNYRLPGVREINLSEARVHLIYGPNGSGKSSIAEALEVVTCGTVERLVQAGVDRYDDVIKHSTSATPATVVLGWSRENVVKYDDPRTIVADGVERPLDKTVHVASFRLDQPVMDRLISHSTHERAKIFMDAFFPKAASSRGKYEQAAGVHQLALQKVDALVDRLTIARQSLAELQEHKASASIATSDPFPSVLNKWLEQTALLDLLQRQRVVRATLDAAQLDGWKAVDGPGGAAVSALAGTIDLAALERFEQESKAAVDVLQAKLESFRETTEVNAAGAASPVSRSVVESLNAVSPFLFAADDIESYGRFGDKVAAVFNTGGPPTYGSIIIGSEKWTTPVLRDLDLLIETCKAVRADEAAPDWPGKSPCPEYDEARQTQARHVEAGRELTRNFIERLRPDEGADGEFDGSLIAALNEVMALFTSARWAYPDILLPPKLEGDKVGVAMHLDGGKESIRAEVHLNTAELNLFTVALFILCIGCVRKPLNMLILDDPLQNMDELTSTALARGLAKMVRLWANLGRSEELLILFHGYNDLERFSAEIEAATYRLPWLSPSTAPTSVPPVTGAVPAGEMSAVQKIDGLSPAFSSSSPDAPVGPASRRRPAARERKPGRA